MNHPLSPGEGGPEGGCPHPPVDEVLPLQVLHGGGDLRGHVEQHHGVHLLPVALAQVVQQVAVRHELRDDVEGGLPCAHPWGVQ